MNGLARVISFLFHPLFMATYLFGMFILIMPGAIQPFQAEQSGAVMQLIVLITLLLPAIIIFLFKTLGLITSLTMPSRRERIFPFVVMSIIYCTTTLMFHYRNGANLTDNFFKFLIIIDALVLISLLATLFYKVSIHSLAIWGVIGILLPINKIAEQVSVLNFTLALIVAAGLVMSARLQLNAHTPREVLAGSVLGFATGFSAMLFLF